MKRGFRSLFYGPPGTGKTLTATLLGKQFKKRCIQDRSFTGCV
ncbi:AAA family ATPase [Paraflavitalea speifideaquila]